MRDQPSSSFHGQETKCESLVNVMRDDDDKQYEAMLSRLSALGEIDTGKTFKLEDLEHYKSLGFASEDVPLLCSVLEAEIEGTELYMGADMWWLPIHAWRLLGALHAPESLSVLVEYLSKSLANDWNVEELPLIIPTFGKVAVPLLKKVLMESEGWGEDVDSDAAVIHTLHNIAEDDLTIRNEACQAFREKLSGYLDNLVELNGWLIDSLVVFHDEKAVPLIDACFNKDLTPILLISRQDVEDRWPEYESLASKIQPIDTDDKNDLTSGLIPSYRGDASFERLLMTINSTYSLYDAKMLLLGTIVGIDTVQPSWVIGKLRTDDLDGTEYNFITEGEALRFFGQVMALGNEMTDFQKNLFPFPDPRDDWKKDAINIFGSDESPLLRQAALFQYQMRLGRFIDALENTRTTESKFEVGSTAHGFLSFLKQSLTNLEARNKKAYSRKLSPEESAEIDAILDGIKNQWNSGYLSFVKACGEARARYVQVLQFEESNGRLGRNDPCPCGSGKKYKRCCLH